MDTPRAMASVTHASMYVSGLVQGSSETEITDEKLMLIEKGCKQLEAACRVLESEIK